MIEETQHSNEPSEPTIGQRIKGFLLGSGAGFKKLSEAFRKLRIKCSELRERVVSNIVSNWESETAAGKRTIIYGTVAGTLLISLVIVASIGLNAVAIGLGFALVIMILGANIFEYFQNDPAF